MMSLISVMYSRKRRVLSTEPRGTPRPSAEIADLTSLTTTVCDLPVRS